MKLTTTQRHELIEQHLPIAKQLADRYRTCGVAWDDLYQEACLGLAEAARHFDTDISSEDNFREYAGVCARHRIINLIDSELGHRSATKLPDLPAPEPDQNTERAAEELWSAAEILDQADRDLIADRYGLDGRPPQGLYEMCSRRDMSMSALKRRLDGIRRELRIELVKRGWRNRAGGPTEPKQAHLNFA